MPASGVDSSMEREDGIADSDLILPCEFYGREYAECKSFKGKNHQRYLDGESRDCAPWQTAYKNCFRFTEKNDIAAGREVVKFEQVLRKERQMGLLRNDVWNLRFSPPSDWVAPLPADLTKDHPGSFLQQAKEDVKAADKKAPKPSLRMEEMRMAYSQQCSIM